MHQVHPAAGVGPKRDQTAARTSGEAQGVRTTSEVFPLQLRLAWGEVRVSDLDRPADAEPLVHSGLW